MKTASGLTLIALGAVLAFAVTGRPGFSTSRCAAGSSCSSA
jgi:hypothetical protein